MMKSFSWLAGLALLLSSCSVHQGTFSPTSFEQPHRKVASAVGISKVIKPLYLGGWSSDALVLDAKNSMQQFRPLAENERYANTTLDIRKTYWIFGSTTKVVLSADVIRFGEESTPPTHYIDSNLHYAIGDTVLIGIRQLGVIIAKARKNNRFVIQYTDDTKQCRVRIKTYSSNRLYSTSPHQKSKGFKIGDKVEVVFDDYEYGNVGKQAVVVGLKQDELLVQLVKNEVRKKFLHTQLKQVP